MPLLIATTYFMGALYGEYIHFRSGTRFSLYAAIYVSAVASGAGWIYFGIVHPYTTTQIYPNHDAIGVYCLAVFGVMNLILFSRRLREGTKDKNIDFSSTFAVTAIGILTSLYVLGVVADHFWFFRDKSVGVGSAKGLGAKDVQCDMPLLVRIEADGASYRCPTNMLFGDIFNQPLAPWPTYRAGKSIQLKEAIVQLEEEAKHNTDAPKISAVPMAPGTTIKQEGPPQ